jgi:hypothetical protein
MPKVDRKRTKKVELWFYPEEWEKLKKEQVKLKFKCLTNYIKRIIELRKEIFGL